MTKIELFRLFGIIDVNGNMAISQLRDVTAIGQKVEGTLKSIAKQAVGTAAGFAMFSAITPAFNAVKDAAWGFNSQLEQIEIAFTTMLGSGEKAKAFLGELKDFAAKTPFEFPDLLDASKRMMALGFETDEVLPTLVAVGDAAAGLGMGREGINRIVLALGQMRAKGKVTGEEMRQLSEAGIPAWEMLAKAMGKPVAEVMKLSEKGLIPAKEATDVLIAGMSENFPGMMEKLSESAEGMVSTIRDNIRNLMSKMTLGTYEALKGIIRYIRDATNQIQKVFEAGGFKAVYEIIVPPDIRNSLEPILQTFSEVFRTIIDTAKTVAPVLADLGRTALQLLTPVVIIFGSILKAAAAFAQGVAQHWGTIKPILVTVLGTFLSYKAVALTLTQAKLAMNAFKGAATMGGSTLQLISRLTGQYALEVALLTRQMGVAPGKIGKVSAALSALKKTFLGTKAPMLVISAGVAGLALLAGLVIKNWEPVPLIFKNSLEMIGAAFNWGGKFIAVILDKMQYDVAFMVEKIVGNLLLLAEKAMRILGPLSRILPEQYKIAYEGLQQAVADARKGLGNRVLSAAQAMGESRKELKQAGADLKTAAGEFAASSKILGNAIWNDLKGIFGKTSEAIQAGLGSLTGTTQETSQAADKMGQSFEEASEKLRQAKLNNAAADGKNLAKAWSAAARSIEGVISSAGKTIATDSQRSLLELTKAMEEAVAETENVLKGGGGKKAKAIYQELTAAMDLVRLAISDKSGKAGDDMLAHLARAANAAATAIKDETGNAARSLYYSLSVAALDAADRLKELAEKTRRESIKTLDTLFSAVKGALRRQVEAQQKADRDRLRSTVETERERVRGVIEAVELENEARIRVIQDDLDLMDEAERKRKEAADDARALAKIEALKTKLEEAVTAQERQRIQEDLSEAILDNEERLRKRRLDTRRKEKQQEIEIIQEGVRKRKQDAEDELNTFIKAKETELSYLENEYYPKRLKDMALTLETEKMLLDGNMKEILALLEEHEFGWQDLGKSYGKRMVEGARPFFIELQEMVKNAMSTLGGLTNRQQQATKYTAEIRGIPQSELAKLRYNSQKWWEVHNDPTLNPAEKAEKKTILHAENAKIQAQYGISAGASKNEINWSKMHHGGEVKQTPLGNILRGLLTLKPREVPVILEQGEWVLPRKAVPQLGGFSFAGAGPQLAGGLAGTKGVTVYVDMHDNIFQDGTDAGSKLERALKRLGI